MGILVKTRAYPAWQGIKIPSASLKQPYQRGHAAGFQIELLNDSAPRRLSHLEEVFRLRKHLTDSLGETFDIEKIDQQAAFSMLQKFGHQRLGGTDDETRTTLTILLTKPIKTYQDQVIAKFSGS
jgi:chromosomal replication initiation ATPase DnaA